MNKMYYLLYIITPTLGLLKNYIKNKQCDFAIYIRSPILYIFFHNLLHIWETPNIVLKTLIFERWFWFLDKILFNWSNNTYQINKEKYIKKYGLVYKDNKKVTISDEISVCTSK